MDKQPLKPAHNGAFLVNEAAATDPICRAAMASYMESLRLEEERRERIRESFRTTGKPPWDQGETGVWDISDRH